MAEELMKGMSQISIDDNNENDGECSIKVSSSDDLRAFVILMLSILLDHETY
jgi:hypothetical protein